MFHHLLLLGAPPSAPSPFCAKYHAIHDANVYDPSGPLLDLSGTWHLWEDFGSWSHWTSTDLIHWSGSFGASTHFSRDTGSVSPTPSGIYAFWPIMDGPGKGAIGSAKATNDSMLEWDHRGPTIPKPVRINTGYRDPVRAFEHNGKWYVGVGCGNSTAGAQFCLFEASDDTLSEHPAHMCTLRSRVSWLPSLLRCLAPLARSQGTSPIAVRCTPRMSHSARWTVTSCGFHRIRVRT